MQTGRDQLQLSRRPPLTPSPLARASAWPLQAGVSVSSCEEVERTCPALKVSAEPERERHRVVAVAEKVSLLHGASLTAHSLVSIVIDSPSRQMG